MSVIPDQMILLAEVPTLHAPMLLHVHRDYDSVLLGAWRLDLDGVGRLQVALDRAVEGIRDYQQRKAEEEK